MVSFVIGAWPAFVVKGALSKDKMAVIEVEAWRIVEQHLTNLAMKGILVDVDLEM